MTIPINLYEKLLLDCLKVMRRMSCTRFKHAIKAKIETITDKTSKTGAVYALALRLVETNVNKRCGCDTHTVAPVTYNTLMSATFNSLKVMRRMCIAGSSHAILTVVEIRTGETSETVAVNALSFD